MELYIAIYGASYLQLHGGTDTDKEDRRKDTVSEVLKTGAKLNTMKRMHR